jgi:hypothetical protein
MGRNPREADFWTPEPLLRGETVFVLASGPSLQGFDFDRLRGLNTIAVNSTAKLIPWADMLFFTDNSWFQKNRAFVESWAGMIVTLSRAAKRTHPDLVRRIEAEPRPDFPPAGTCRIKAGRSSGHSAVSLAVSMCAARVVLLGFDMRFVGERSHCHDDYENKDTLLYERDFAPAFDGWRAAALRAGTEIVNATPGSALKEFPMVDIAEEIARAPKRVDD